MNQLTIKSLNGKLVTDSREVADMIGKRHDHLLADIRKYVDVLDSQSFGSQEFFILSSYLNAQNRTQPCFLLTKKGCDMVANKMTGEKGILFTAAYVSKFEEMENQLRNNVHVLDERTSLIKTMKLTIETLERQEQLQDIVNGHQTQITKLETKIEEQITLTSGEQRRLQKGIATKVYELERDPAARPRLFKELHREIKDRFGVASYKDVKQKELQVAIRYVENWIPRKVVS